MRAYRTCTAGKQAGGKPRRSFSIHRDVVQVIPAATPTITLTLGVLTMLHWALIFLVIALVAAVFGFGGIAASAAGIAKILFFVFLVLFLVSVIVGGIYRPAP
jgi:uncharacterized membrane protein YtjA (UPF0391 family)